MGIATLELAPETEQKSPEIETRKLNPENQEEVKKYFDLLTHPQAYPHFAGLPKTSEEFQKMLLERKDLHPLLAIKNGEIIGGITIQDAAPQEHDHWLRWAVVNPLLWDQGFGKEMIKKAVDWAFSPENLTYDQRERTKIDAGVNVGIEGWIKMVAILLDLGFEFRMWLPQEVTVIKNGQEVTCDTVRLEILKEKWKRKK